MAEMGESKPLKCKKCGKPLGYISVLTEGLLGMQQRLDNVKLVAVCMDCYKKS